MKIHPFCCLLLICLLSAVPGCRMVPVQMARVTQIETYEQWYEFSNETYAGEVFEKIIGTKNWQTLIDHQLHKGIVQDVLRKKVLVRGNLVFTLSLAPRDHDRFFVEGVGRYQVIRTTTNEILFSADYHILDNIHSINDLRKNKILVIETRQRLTKHFAPARPDYYHDFVLKFRLYMRKITKNVYALDYDRKHDFLIDNDVVGYLHFFKPKHANKLIDLRGLDLLYDDY